jgi:hypothetical protein
MYFIVQILNQIAAVYLENNVGHGQGVINLFSNNWQAIVFYINYSLL